MLPDFMGAELGCCLVLLFPVGGAACPGSQLCQLFRLKLHCGSTLTCFSGVISVWWLVRALGCGNANLGTFFLSPGTSAAVNEVPSFPPPLPTLAISYYILLCEKGWVIRGWLCMAPTVTSTWRFAVGQGGPGHPAGQPQVQGVG